MKKPAKHENKPGPEPERLNLDGGWKDAVKKAVNTPPPKDGGDDDTKKGSDDDDETMS